MKKKIERILFLFQDGKNERNDLTSHFFGLATLLSRLVNEKYKGKKIQFVNIDFSSEYTYELFPNIPKDYIHYYASGGGHLRYYGVLDFNTFNYFSPLKQNEFIWERACFYLKQAAEKLKNNKLLEATNYAYQKGLKIGLNPDYRMLTTPVTINQQSMLAALWLHFREDYMYAVFTLEKEDKVVFEKVIDKGEHGMEFFLEMYKSLVVKGNTITIKGARDVEYLPLDILIDEGFV